MKKYLLIILIVIGCFLLPGCSSGKSMTILTGQEFYDIARDNGFTPVNALEYYSTFATDAYIINSDFEVTFLAGKNVYDIEGVFIDECENVYKSLTSTENSETSSGENWNLFTATDSEMKKYYYILLVDNTYIYVEGSTDNKDRIDSFITALGY